MRIIIILVVLGFISCKKNEVPKDNYKKVVALNDSLNNKLTTVEKDGKRLIALMVSYADAYPKDSLADNYLFAAGYFARTLQDYDSAMKYWDRLVKEYPNYEKLPEVLYYQGFVAENESKDVLKAKAIYEDFLRRWPNHTYSANVRASLEHVGKSADDIFKTIKPEAPKTDSQTIKK